MYKLVAGSSCDLTEELKSELDITLVPFKITIDGKEYIDDDKLDVLEMIEHMKKSKEVKTACPSPGDFLKAFEGGDHILVTTISKKLSGAYNSANIAKNMFLEKYPDRKIHIFDSETASAGETKVVLKIQDEIEKGSSWEGLIENVEQYIKEIKTFFLLESLQNLIKNGRISKTAGLIANILNFKPIMQDNGQGEIELYEKVRGNKKAFNRLVEAIGQEGMSSEGRRLVITHVNDLERAEYIKKKIEEKYDFKEILIIQTAGLCSVYADDGGVVLVY